jgi:hypothetical protein
LLEQHPFSLSPGAIGGQMDSDMYGKMGIGKMNNGYCKEHGEKVIKY